MYRAIYTYPWDLADEGLATALDRIRDAGLDTITLATSYHAGKFLRPHGVTGRVYFPKDGTVYFDARTERYGVVKPLVNPMVAEFDGLARLQEHAPDLARVAWVVCCHNTALGECHPELTTQNAFGDRYIYSLCPAHPAVRDYIVNLCVDIATRYEPRALVLETPGWLGYDHGYHHEFGLVPLNSWARTLLALCFSEASRHAAKAADIDADRLQAQTRTWLDRFFAEDLTVAEPMADAWLLADLVADPDWVAFLKWRCQVVTDLVGAVKAGLPAGTELVVIPTTKRPTAGCWLEGSDLAELANVADALEIPAYEPSAAAVAADAFDVRRRVGQDARLRFILRPSFPDLANGSETVAAAMALQNVGMDGLAFYNYGHMRLANLGHIKAALAALDANP